MTLSISKTALVCLSLDVPRPEPLSSISVYHTHLRARSPSPTRLHTRRRQVTFRTGKNSKRAKRVSVHTNKHRPAWALNGGRACRVSQYGGESRENGENRREAKEARGLLACLVRKGESQIMVTGQLLHIRGTATPCG